VGFLPCLWTVSGEIDDGGTWESTLDFSLDVVDSIGGLDLEGDGLAREGFDEDLHGDLSNNASSAVVARCCGGERYSGERARIGINYGSGLGTGIFHGKAADSFSELRIGRQR